MCSSDLGAEITEADWHDRSRHVLGMLIHGQATDEVDERGRLISGDTLLLIVNSGSTACEFSTPDLEAPGVWREQVNSTRLGKRRYLEPGKLAVAAHSLILLSYQEA